MTISIIISTLYLLLAGAILYKCGYFKTKKAGISICILLILAFTIRVINLKHVSQDYLIFLSNWVEYYKQNGGFSALNDTVGNYNIPYLTFLAAISYIKNVDSLLLIKLLSILFDFILAYGVLKLVSLFRDDDIYQLGAFFTVLFLPTVIVDSSFWGQCDSIYVSFIVLSLYFGLDHRPWLSMLTIAIAFSFKLQAIFVIPVFALMWACGYFKWYHFISFPITYFIMMLPAIISGKPILDSMLMYFSQTDSIGNAYAYNGPTLLAVVAAAQTKLAYLNSKEMVPIVSKIATLVAFVVTVIILIAQLLRRKKLGRKDIIVTAAVFALVIPFLLPHMHERYFFIADILTLVLCIVDIKFAPVFFLTEIASLWCYNCYYQYVLTNEIRPSFYGAFLVLAAIVIILYKMVYRKKTDTDI